MTKFYREIDCKMLFFSHLILISVYPTKTYFFKKRNCSMMTDLRKRKRASIFGKYFSQKPK